MSAIIKTWQDIDFTVAAVPHEYHVDFKIYEVVGYGEAGDGTWSVPDWRREGATDCGDVTESLDDAEAFASGSVKWDGCSNWSFHTESCMHHECGRAGLLRIGEVLARCWDWTAELCPKWSESVTGYAAPEPPK